MLFSRKEYDKVDMFKKLKALMGRLGPGFITGASDDDPSGVATYSQTGALFGYGQLWLALFTAPFMIAIQEMCGRIGMVTGKGISGVMRIHYPRWILYPAVALLVIANVINIGADLGAMAESVKMVVGSPFTLWLIIITVLTVCMEVFIDYRVYSKILRFFAFTLLAYVLTAFLVKQDWIEIFKNTIIPHVTFTANYLMNVVAVLGTTISPYLFFWQADEEVEEEIVLHQIASIGAGLPRIVRQDVININFDTVVGMVFSQVIMFFIIITTAATLFAHGIADINTAPQAALALRPLAGNFAYLLFAAGIMGTGLLAVPVLAGSASYAVSESVGWSVGLGNKLKKSYGFYGVIAFSTIIGLGINYIGIDPIKALYYSAVLNGLIAPPLMVFILLISNSKKIMGQYVNGKLTNMLGWMTILIMGGIGIALLWTLIKGMN